MNATTGATGDQGPTGMTGEQGIVGATGMQGTQGEPGLSGVILGVYETEAELIAAHPTGMDSEFYLVGNITDGYVLYVWNSTALPDPEWLNTGEFTGAVGPQGPQGERGEQGPAGFLEPGQVLFNVTGAEDSETITAEGTLSVESDTLDITIEPGPAIRIETPTEHTGGFVPFATGADAVPLVTNTQGRATNMVITAFGARSSAISITTTGFTFPQGNNHFYAFALSHDIKVKSIYATMSNYGDLNAPTGSSVFPYIILATAARDSNNFTFLDSTKAVASLPWSGGSTIPANSNLYAELNDINEIIPAGSRIAICCAYEMTGGSNTVFGYYFYYSGSIYYE